jgi:hypothetical protein
VRAQPSSLGMLGDGQRWRAVEGGGYAPKGCTMNENDIDDRPDVNTGKVWSEMDLFDLTNRA